VGEELVAGDHLNTSSVYLSSDPLYTFTVFTNIWKCLLLFELPISRMWCYWDADTFLFVVWFI